MRNVKSLTSTYPQVCNGVADCPNSLLGGVADEQGCRTWNPWGQWSSCSASCGTGSMSRQRLCPPGDTLHHCRGQDIQRQQCFTNACPGKTLDRKLLDLRKKYLENQLMPALSLPVDGQWLPWVTWSNCSSGCGGVQVRHRACIPPRNGGRDCTELPGQDNHAMEMSKSHLKTRVFLPWGSDLSFKRMKFNPSNIFTPL